MRTTFAAAVAALGGASRSSIPLAVFALACGGAPPPPVAAMPVVASSPPPAASPAAPPAPDSATVLASKIDPIFASYASGHVPGCAVGVYRAGETLFAKGYGYADLEHDVPITDSTVFYIASVSKQFTAAAVLLLAGEGKLSLDDDVRKYVPELPDYGKPITLRHLLHHTSGVRDYGLLLSLQGQENDRVTNDDLLWLLAHQHALNFPPGAAFMYSNSGYFLLSIVVERVSGKAFSAFLDERVFEPLAMDASWVEQDQGRVIPGRAIGYAPRPDKTFRRYVSNREATGATAVMTTVRDLAKWDANFYAARIGGQALVQGLRTLGRLANGTPLTYATGLHMGESLGRPFEWHSGGGWGYRAHLARYPGDRLAVAVLCNNASANVVALAESVAKVMLPDVPAVSASASPQAPAAAALAVVPALLAGAYLDPAFPSVLVIEARDGSLWLRTTLHDGPPARELVAIGPSELAYRENRQTRFTFEPAKASAPARIVMHPMASHDETYVRFEPVETVPPATLAEYVGRYGSDEFARDVQVVVKDGKLFVSAWGGAPGSEPLQPIARDVFLQANTGPGNMGATFERGPQGRIKAVVFDTDTARRVRLQRR
jgi:CubicO group peptidase (beta-lactamase class C family)